MKKRINPFTALMVICLLALLSSPLFAAANVLFILDSSGSMAGRVDGVPKINAAKQVLTALLRDLPKETKIGLMTYGHRTKGDCKDVELLVPIGPNAPDKVATRLTPLTPKGKTPLAYSLEQAAPLFKSLAGQNNAVILVSDGIETCGGDPKAAAAKLAAANIGVKVHVVGFDVKGAELKQLESIAKAGKGRFFEAKNTAGLKNAFAQVKKEVVQAKPEPPKPQFKEYFIDNFDGDKLKKDWQVLNPNPDRFIVEKGGLLVIAAAPGNLANDTVENLFLLDKPLPPGDWILTAKVKVDIQTVNEHVFLGLFENKQEFLVLQNIHIRNMSGTPHTLGMELLKNARGKISKFSKEFFRVGWSYLKDVKNLPQPLLLRLRKVGRTFFGEAMLEKAKNPQWKEIGKFTILRPRGKVAIGFYQSTKVSGESTATFDWVKIEAAQ
jgi:uncharacterized protein YegL